MQLQTKHIPLFNFLIIADIGKKWEVYISLPRTILSDIFHSGSLTEHPICYHSPYVNSITLFNPDISFPIQFFLATLHVNTIPPVPLHITTLVLFSLNCPLSFPHHLLLLGMFHPLPCPSPGLSPKFRDTKKSMVQWKSLLNDTSDLQSGCNFWIEQ